MDEARLEDSGSGLTPVTDGWFVVNAREAEWWFAESRGARCAFENEYGDPPVEFTQIGINLTVLGPGQTSLYHAEANGRITTFIACDRDDPKYHPVCENHDFQDGRLLFEISYRKTNLPQWRAIESRVQRSRELQRNGLHGLIYRTLPCTSGWSTGPPVR